MSKTIEVRLTEKPCPLGEAYATKHSTTPPKTAVLSCEGMCLRGEIARRAANLITHALAPERTVRVCHGGLLEAGGGMRHLVERADTVLMLDGCSMACGTRLLKGAVPQVKPTVLFTDRLIAFDRGLSAGRSAGRSGHGTPSRTRCSWTRSVQWRWRCSRPGLWGWV